MFKLQLKTNGRKYCYVLLTTGKDFRSNLDGPEINILHTKTQQVLLKITFIIRPRNGLITKY